MKDYELSVLFHPDLEMNQEPALDKIRKMVKSAGGKIVNEENEGKKRLAYPIKGLQFALYYFANIELPSDGPDKISTTMNITDEVIRYLLVRTDARKAKYATRRAEAEAHEAEAHEASKPTESEAEKAETAEATKDSDTKDKED